MWNKTLRALVVALALLLLSTAAFAAEPELLPGEAPDDAQLDVLMPEAAEPAEPAVALPCIQLRLKDSAELHSAYIHGYPDRTFRPGATISRAEAAQILYGLLEPAEAPELEYTDVSGDNWYYDAVNTMVCAGLLDWNGGTIRPNAAITRGEFLRMAVYFAPETEEECTFRDLQPGDAYYAEASKAAAVGWVSGYPDGTFRPDKNLSRAEVAVIANNMRGGSADRTYTQSILISPFNDVQPMHWAFDAVMEAAISHTVAEREPDGGEIWNSPDESVLLRPQGLYFVGVEQYYIGEDGRPVTDQTVNGLSYGPDGRYTSGNGELDELVKAAMQSFVTGTMTQEERLHAAYLYTRDSFTYLKRNYYDLGDNSYTEQEALTMLKTGRGNCYCYAGVFYYLSRQLGYPAVPISGNVGTNRSPHGWVEIDFDGVTYIYDTELEMAYRAKKIYYYDFYRMSYSAVPWPYRK